MVEFKRETGPDGRTEYFIIEGEEENEWIRSDRCYRLDLKR